MPKRAERRHHEERIKDKFRKVANRLAGKVDFWIGKWDHKWENGKLVSSRHHLDRTGAIKRMQHIDKMTVQMAHHPRHQCNICKLPPDELRNRRMREIERKAPMIVDDD